MESVSALENALTFGEGRVHGAVLHVGHHWPHLLHARGVFTVLVNEMEGALFEGCYVDDHEVFGTLDCNRVEHCVPEGADCLKVHLFFGSADVNIFVLGGALQVFKHHLADESIAFHSGRALSLNVPAGPLKFTNVFLSSNVGHQRFDKAIFKVQIVILGLHLNQGSSHTVLYFHGRVSRSTGSVGS